ncbi:MAG: baseplate assembly protein, partial [Azovibrio sp.]
QNLVAFARAPMLDYLGELVGVTRLPAQPARTTIRYTLSAPRDTGLLIPAGSRVENGGGTISFATETDAVLPAGQLSIDITALCENTGIAGNGWQPGQINTLVDELQGTSGIEVALSNTDITSGGFDQEDDDRLRERIKLAPEAFSTAGSREAYRFHALKAHQSIIDVAVIPRAPVTIQLYPLLTTGLPDANILSLVKATCSADRVRPLTDEVEVLPPTPVDYSIEAQLTLYATTDSTVTLASAQAAANAFVQGRAAGLGRDVVPSQIIAALSVPGVYQVQLQSPTVMTLAGNEWANCTGIKLGIAGIAHG